MNFREYLSFLWGNAYRVPFIKGAAATMLALSLGAVLVGMFRKSPGGGQPEAQGRKAA